MSGGELRPACYESLINPQVPGNETIFVKLTKDWKLWGACMTELGSFSSADPGLDLLVASLIVSN